MQISVRYDALTVDIYESVRTTANFHRYEREDVQAALDGGLCSVVAYVDGVPAGIGRLVGDGRAQRAQLGVALTQLFPLRW